MSQFIQYSNAVSLSNYFYSRSSLLHPMQSDGASSATSDHGIEHPRKKNRSKANSETSKALRRHQHLSYQTPDASFVEENDNHHRGKRRRLLLSPSTRSSLQPESYQSRQSIQQTLSKRPQSAPESAVADLDSAFYIKHPTHHPQGLKRKRPEAEAEAEIEAVPSTPQNRSWASTAIDASTVLGPEIVKCEKEDTEAYTPISFWAQTGRWPENFLSMSQGPSIMPEKRQSSSSYTKSYRLGAVLKAHTAAHENHFATHGLFMKELEGRSHVHKDGVSLCTDLLGAVHPEPDYTPFPLSKYLLVWQQAQNRNEARVYRDLTPLLVPSPELLSICGCEELKHLVEEISVEWTKGKTLAGPKPKPDFAVGVAPSAFSEQEILKLQNHRSFERPTAFTDNMYFPFLLCEAKCGSEGINQADRQNMHSSSLAVDAILQLYRAIDESKAIELSGQILVFSVSHDNERVKLYGHFAVVEGKKKTCFYRYPIASLVLDFEEPSGRKKTHDFVREVYEKFYPAHLKRICDALAAMKDPRAPSMTSLSVEDGEEGEGATTQEQDASVRSSQENAGFRVPGTPASKRQKGEVARLQEQLDVQREQLDEQREAKAALQKQIGELMKMLTAQSAQIGELIQKR